ncbi:MAG TPA: SDR family oxidoreductase [Bacillales bacterium]|nr:SDR family oxidoreductase [Bacillales bacterium]
MDSLAGTIALVTGASRGAGRGIAIELGKAGAMVYVTGRSVRGKSTNGWPGTIDDTVDEIQSVGGTGTAVQCDHTDDEQTKEVIEKIRREHGKLDLLVNNAWGGSEHDISGTYEENTMDHWNSMFTAGVRAQLATNYYAVPFMRETGGGLIIHTTFWDDWKYTGHFYYDLAKNTLIRIAYGLSEELKGKDMAVLAVSPGFMRTEIVLKDFHTDQEHWREVEALKVTETPHYVGKGIVALASDPNVIRKTGKVFRSGDLAEEYGFTDIDGKRIPPFHI